jgi:hypothetical protein
LQFGNTEQLLNRNLQKRSCFICGFAGTTALWQLVNFHPVKKITVFEATGVFCPGYAYQLDECKDYLINNTTDTMCLIPSNRKAFIEWLSRFDPSKARLQKRHLPRAEYGKFLKSVVDNVVIDAAIRGIGIEFIASEARSIDELPSGGVKISWLSGSIEADAVLLTTGRSPEKIEAQIMDIPASRYFRNHVMREDLDEVALDAVCYIRGASLSAYDVVNRLFSETTGSRFVDDGQGGLTYIAGPNRRRVVIGSRSGRLKKMQSLHPMTLDLKVLTESNIANLAATKALGLKDFKALISQEAAHHGLLMDWNALADPYLNCSDAFMLNDCAQKLLECDIQLASEPSPGNFLVDLASDLQLLLWNCFAKGWIEQDAKAAYQQQFETAMLCYAAPCPVPTARRLLALMRAGCLTVRAGINEVHYSHDSDEFTVKHRYGMDRTDVLIDASGALDRRLTSAGQPELVQSLVSNRLLSPYRSYDQIDLGADVDLDTMRSRSSHYVYVANMMLWGPGFFTSSAFMVAAIVEKALCAMFGDQNKKTML